MVRVRGLLPERTMVSLRASGSWSGPYNGLIAITTAMMIAMMTAMMIAMMIAMMQNPPKVRVGGGLHPTLLEVAQEKPMEVTLTRCPSGDVPEGCCHSGLPKCSAVPHAPSGRTFGATPKPSFDVVCALSNLELWSLRRMHGTQTTSSPHKA